MNWKDDYRLKHTTYIVDTKYTVTLYTVLSYEEEEWYLGSYSLCLPIPTELFPTVLLNKEPNVQIMLLWRHKTANQWMKKDAG